MVKAGDQVDAVIAGLAPHLGAGDILIKGGNSHYRETGRRAREMEPARPDEALHEIDISGTVDEITEAAIRSL